MPPAPSPTAADDKKKGDVTLTGASPSDKEAVAPAPSPSTAGEQTAKADSMPEVPGDLLLPESAPKAGEDKPKESKPGENSPLPIAIAESKPLDEPKKIEVPTPTPIEPAAKPAALAGGKSVVEQEREAALEQSGKSVVEQGATAALEPGAKAGLVPGDKPAVEPGARSALAAGDKPAVEPGAKSTLQQGGSGVIPARRRPGRHRSNLHRRPVEWAWRRLARP